MTTLSSRTTGFVAVALLAPFMAAVWLMAKPTFVSGSTYAVFAAVVITAGAIAINAWQDAQATTSTSQVIHDAEISTPTTKAH
jgi:drug/metabolite transporter (DMT)-like permease